MTKLTRLLQNVALRVSSAYAPGEQESLHWPSHLFANAKQVLLHRRKIDVSYDQEQHHEDQRNYEIAQANTINQISTFKHIARAVFSVHHQHNQRMQRFYATCLAFMLPKLTTELHAATYGPDHV